ncbi:uncharacterized protein LOC124158721 [Ischnura elegans]|uniref:uncharacterized protein LOC124158721 n=1 Tax=Ischnura elegans TaxID=197161 RepID=UPI001ED877E7|nr:uncharacterized protein LOC124158721 [Ischnura elegans]
MEQDEITEEILNVKWGSVLEHQKELLPEDYLQKNSAAYRILNDEFTKEWSSDSSDDANCKKNVPVKGGKKAPKTALQVHQPYKLFTSYPKHSTLTARQQKAYLEFMKKFSNKYAMIDLADQEEFQRYQKLQVKVAAEQIQYLEFLRNFALQNQSRYSSMSHDIERYVNERWKVKLKNPLKYPRYYRPYRTIGLVSNDAKEPLDLIPLDTIVKRGKFYNLMTKTTGRIGREYYGIVTRHPIITEEIANRTRLTTFNCPVSRDQNAEIYAAVMNVDFVLSSSSVKKICDNFPPFNKFWEIPVVVKECDVEENGIKVKKKVVFIDKALPPRRMTVVDKLLCYHKIAVKCFFVPYRFQDLVDQEYGSAKRKHDKKLEENPDEPFDLDWNNTDDLDCFGVDGSTSSRKTAEKLDKDSTDVQSSEQNDVSNQSLNETCAPQESYDQSRGDVIENDNEAIKLNRGSVENVNDMDASSSCMSDSGDENLVIDDPDYESKSQNPKVVSSKDSRIMSSKSSEVNVVNQAGVKESPKQPARNIRQTRNMAKMLQTINKVEEIASAKINTGKVPMVENTKSSSIDKNSLNVNDKQNKSVANSGMKINRETSLLDELIAQQEKWLAQEQGPKAEFCPKVPPDIKERMECLKKYRPIPPPRGRNYVYRLFNLKKQDMFSPGYRLLVRHKVDAQEAAHKPRPVTIVPKLEFQPEFGAEIVTVSEMIQEWLSIRLRPTSFLIRARLDAFTSDVLMVERKELKDLRSEENYHNVQASSCLNTLETVLRATRDLPPGEYMLTHEPKMGPFASIYMAADDTRGGVYDLHAQYDVDTTATQPQVLSNLWVPIDFSIVTPLHEKLERVPGTFTPSDYNKVFHAPRRRKWGSKKKKQKTLTPSPS